MKTSRMSLSVAFALSLFAHAVHASTYYWREVRNNGYLSFVDPANWIMGTSDQGEPATDVPGENDWLHYTNGYANRQWMDMGGQSVSVLGIDFTYAILQYGWRYMAVRNGSLTFTESFLNRQVYMTVDAGGCFTVAPTCRIEFTWGGAMNVYKVNDGGRLELYGPMFVGTLCVTNYEGGVVVVDPASFRLTEQGAAANESCFVNDGNMSFPHGLTIAPDGKYGVKQGCRYPFIQRTGTMSLGGSFVADGTLYNEFTFDMQGGALSIVGDVSMPLFNSVGMLTDGTTATVDIAEGTTLDWSNATFANGTTLNVTGSGTLILGSSYPSVLNLSEGITLGLGEASADMHVINGVAGANFIVPEETCVFRNQVLVRTGDADMLAEIAAKLIVGKTGWSAVASAGRICLSWSEGSRKFIWKGMAKLCSFFDYTKWSTSWDESLPQWESSEWSNEEQLIPGENDYWLYGTGLPYKAFYFDMDGATYRVGGFWGTDGQGAYQNEPGWPHDMLVTNGTLEIVRNFTNQHFACTVASSGRFVLAGTSVSRLGYTKSFSNVVAVANGGEMRCLGTVYVNNVSVRVAAGGRCVLNPVQFNFDDGALDELGRGIFSEGVLEIPDGLAVGSVNASDKVTAERAPWFTISSFGSLLLGGDVSFTESGEYGRGKVCLDVLGGVVNVTNSTAFPGLESVTFTNDAVTVAIDEGATLSLTNAMFGTGTAITVVGAGTLAMGGEYPESLELGNGVTLEFAKGGAAFGNISGIDGANFVLGDEIRRRTVLGESSDAAMLAAIADKIVLPEGFIALVDGRQLIVRKRPVGTQVVLR